MYKFFQLEQVLGVLFLVQSLEVLLIKRETNRKKNQIFNKLLFLFSFFFLPSFFLLIFFSLLGSLVSVLVPSFTIPYLTSNIIQIVKLNQPTVFHVPLLSISENLSTFVDQSEAMSLRR